MLAREEGTDDEGDQREAPRRGVWVSHSHGPLHLAHPHGRNDGQSGDRVVTLGQSCFPRLRRREAARWRGAHEFHGARSGGYSHQNPSHLDFLTVHHSHTCGGPAAESYI